MKKYIRCVSAVTDITKPDIQSRYFSYPDVIKLLSEIKQLKRCDVCITTDENGRAVLLVNEDEYPL